ncbi:hypothetical protein CHS0354_014825 [Potamilus streckersoni]|uniref:Uncharacterized protein n=1 Tax=Potamilus streckersoni TaxID=2493646 RepID=A0AAE0VKM5_9BIVA|nr:hypothetical protein CHS0354_014825 [Potamilus streckersoni]
MGIYIIVGYDRNTQLIVRNQRSTKPPLFSLLGFGRPPLSIMVPAYPPKRSEERISSKVVQLAKADTMFSTVINKFRVPDYVRQTADHSEYRQQLTNIA